jgi:lipopolysaccharide transport system ATP-binding protein
VTQGTHQSGRNTLGETLIRLDKVEKRYPQIGGQGRLRLLATLLLGRTPSHAFRALSDISLEIRRGESFGLVGVNGAGKSTLLKIIAGVTKPSSGEIQVTGRIGALLELGTGFHPEYTGRENIYLATALMGLSKSQTQEKIDEILAFADIGEFIDHPIKHYSSGMSVRLGFAVATTVRPDVLITDEVLAVGDESFQRKCIRWIEHYLSDGGTLLLCSHAMYHIQKLCREAAWLHEGRIKLTGDAADVTREYLAFHEKKSNQEADSEEKSLDAASAAPGYQVVAFELRDASGQRLSSVLHQGEILAWGRLKSADGRSPHVALGVVRADGTAVYGTSSEVDGKSLRADSDGQFTFCVRFDHLLLLPGSYIFRAHAMDPEALRVLDTVEVALTVTGASRELGMARLAHSWIDL